MLGTLIKAVIGAGFGTGAGLGGCELDVIEEGKCSPAVRLETSRASGA